MSPTVMSPEQAFSGVLSVLRVHVGGKRSILSAVSKFNVMVKASVAQETGGGVILSM